MLQANQLLELDESVSNEFDIPPINIVDDFV